jgi:hypothetical protein
MGWKSTLEITREEAIRLIQKRLLILDRLTNQELEDLVDELGYGEDSNLEYYGHNFNVVNEDEYNRIHEERNKFYNALHKRF